MLSLDSSLDIRYEDTSSDVETINKMMVFMSDFLISLSFYRRKESQILKGDEW